jgi:anti-sigma regulatory factor (Ser/Thr protein kinase)
MAAKPETGGSSMLEIPLDGNTVDDIDGTLAELSDTSDEVKLCFDNHWPEDSQEVALLTAALMGSLRDRQMTVDVVDQDAVQGLLHFGIATALWRRPQGRTTFTEIAKGLDRPSLGAMWTSGSRAATEALFAANDPSTIGAFGRRYATFVNPHLSSSIEGHPDVVFLVRRWLTQRLAETQSLEEVRPIVETIGVALDELVANVQEHAAGRARPRPECLVQVSLTASNGVRCSVMDTGVGISESLGSKVEPTVQPKERLCRLLEGKIPGWDAGRGVGLPRVKQLMSASGGRLSIATENLRLTALPEQRVEATHAAFDLQGTVVGLTIPATGSS